MTARTPRKGAASGAVYAYVPREVGRTAGVVLAAAGACALKAKVSPPATAQARKRRTTDIRWSCRHPNAAVCPSNGGHEGSLQRFPNSENEVVPAGRSGELNR